MLSSKVLQLFITSSLANNINNIIIDRRDFLPSLLSLVSSTNSDQRKVNIDDGNILNGVALTENNANDTTKSPDDSMTEWTITLPLERCSGGTNCVRVSVRGQPKQRGKAIVRPKRIYRMIVDTGSPYLTIPKDFRQEKSQSPYFNTVLEYSSLSINDEDSSNSVNQQNQLFFDNQILDYVLNSFFSDIEGDVPFSLEESIYKPTQDIYGSKLGLIEWKKSPITFRNDRIVTSKITETEIHGKAFEENIKFSLVLGVLDKTLSKESGGPLLGLVKNSNPATNKVQLRPTFLDQIRILPMYNAGEENNDREITSFQIDSPGNRLTFLAQKDASLIALENEDNVNIIELCDLRPLGDFVDHYAFIVDELSLNYKEYILTSKSLSGYSNKNKKEELRPIVAVFDTGLTGCLFTQPLWDALVQNVGIADPSILRSVEVSTSGKKNGKQKATSVTSIQSDVTKNPFFYLSPIELDWFGDEDNAPFVIILGQTFLSQGILTIDIERRIATFQTS